MEEIDLLTIRERLMTQAFLDAMPIERRALCEDI